MFAAPILNSFMRVSFMRKLVVAAIFFAVPVVVQAQDNSSNLTVAANTILSFDIQTADDLEQTKTINNALTIDVKSRKSSASVSAKVSYTNIPYSLASANILGLQFVSSTAPGYAVSSQNIIYLTGTDQLLFTQQKHSANQYRHYVYDLVMKPVGYTASPSNFSFTITFTMSQP